MTKRKTHKNPALIQKREKFSTVFFKKWLGILLASILIYIIGLFMFDGYMKAQAKKDFQEQKAWMLEAYFKPEAESYPEQWFGQIKLRTAALTESSGIVSLLFDADTKEILVGCEEQLFLIKKKTETSPVTFYITPTSRIPGWDNYRQTVASLKTSHIAVSENFILPAFYTDGTDFLPDAFAVEVESFKIFNATYVSESTGAAVDLPNVPLTGTNEPVCIHTEHFPAPENIPEGYERIEVTEDYFHPLVVGYHPNNPYLKTKGIDYAYQVLLANYQSIKDGTAFPIAIDLYEADTFLQLTMCSQDNFALATGQSVTLLCTYHINLWDVYGKWLVLAAVILIIAGLLLALIQAKLSYTRLKAGYDMEDYRKTLMNTMAHDLKSPLMSISGYAENLKDNVHSEKREHYADAILENVQYMDELIASVLELSKTEKTGLHLTKVPTNIRTLIEENLKKHEIRLSECHSQESSAPNASLSASLIGDLTLSVDPILFSQVIDNLLSNATKYAIPDSTLNITLDKNEICFSNACKEDLSDVIDTLCDPFVTADQSRSNKKGSGLGLTIVQNLCTLHGFTFRIEYKEGMFRARIGLK